MLGISKHKKHEQFSILNLQTSGIFMQINRAPLNLGESVNLFLKRLT